MNSLAQQVWWTLLLLALLLTGCHPADKEIGFTKRESRTNQLAATLDGANRWWLGFRQQVKDGESLPLTVRLWNNGSASLDVHTSTNTLVIEPTQSAVVFTGALSSLILNSYSLQSGVSLGTSAERMKFVVDLQFEDRSPKNPIRVIAYTTY
jgi:hypothetical protein